MDLVVNLEDFLFKLTKTNGNKENSDYMGPALVSVSFHVKVYECHIERLKGFTILLFQYFIMHVLNLILQCSNTYFTSNGSGKRRNGADTGLSCVLMDMPVFPPNTFT